MSSLLSFSAGKKAKFVVIAIWIVILALIGPLAGKFEEAQNNEAASFLPKGAESVEALEESRGFPSGETLGAVTVFAAQDALSGNELIDINAFRDELNEDPVQDSSPTGPPVVSPDKSTAFLTTPIAVKGGDSENITLAIEDIRERAQEVPGGMERAVTGSAGFLVDQVEVFDGIGGLVLYIAAVLVLVLLIVIYRSPIFWLIPFFAVVVAEICSRGMGYLLAEAGVTINGQTGGILPVLVFGAGTDYALLVVARYREELRKHEDRHQAMAKALRKAGPAVIASAGTVCAGLLTFALADVAGTAALGPVGAAGVALAAIIMLTMLPALLLVAGRRAFWPFIPRFGSEGADEAHGSWRRIGDRIAVRPRRVWVVSMIALGICMLGLLQLNSDLTSSGGFRDDVDSVKGQELLSEALPPGSTAPSSVIVRQGGPVEQVREAIESVPAVASVGSNETGPPGTQFQVVLDADPYGTDGFDAIAEVRTAAHDVADQEVLVGGPSAQEEELRTSAKRDNLVIIPIALIVVLLILIALLRSIVAPLLLVGTVVISFGAALGIGTFFFENVFGFQGLDPTLPVLSFVFLVALGVDYNIFLMARAREETAEHGTREGIIRALAVTGAVITSAGVVLAGTFGVLTILPLVVLIELGFVIAVGVLLDTFLVRSILVPALVIDIGKRTWWPSALAQKEDTPVQAKD